ncbi:MAG: hypothetical protein KGQ87_06140 [Verrucomicrobia bacterium]|nr:hypothetical protein [Verrucomicrobiota bacterium]
MKIPFFDLTFLDHHRRSNGSVLSSRANGIGNSPTRASQSYLRPIQNATNGQIPTTSHDGPAVGDVKDTRSMTPSAQT